jgi:DMSO/TMAO reductase YedYZ molybdopterin-dependent catalytic subunit
MMPNAVSLLKNRKQHRQVQRPTGELPVLHLEPEIPTPAQWRLRVDGLVRQEKTWPAAEVRSMPLEERVWDFHCVWGWVRPECRWEGASASKLIDMAQPLPDARFALVGCIQGAYASCLTLEEARAGLLAWRLDGEELSSEHGGPLRFVPPPNKWGYKGIKWVGWITLLDSFQPGFWEELVGNPRGDIPSDLLDLQYE